MSFQNYKSANLASGTIKTGISAGVTSLILATGQGDLFPSTYPYFLKIEKYDSGSLLENKPVTKREIVKVTNKSGDTFTITRSAGYCPATSTATTQTNTAYSFDVGDSVFLVMPSEQIKDIQDEVARLETDKADDADVVHKTGDESIAGVKTFLSSPTVPVAVNATEAVNKSQLDSSIISYVQDNIEDRGSLGNKDYITGEALNVGDSLYVERGPLFIEAKSVLNVGDVAGNARQSIKALGSGVGSSQIKLALRKFVSPSVDLNIYIETDNDGKPSGQLFSPNAVTSIASGSLTTSLVDTTLLFSGTTSNNQHLVTLDNTEAGQVGYKGVKVTMTGQFLLLTVVKDSDCTATTAYIYDSSLSLLQSASFSGNTATFNNSNIVNGQSYYIVVGSGGSSYTSVKQTGSASFPYTTSRMNYEEGVSFSNISDTITHASTTPAGASGTISIPITPNKDCFIRQYNAVGLVGNIQLKLGGQVLETAVGGVFSGNYLLKQGVQYDIFYNVNSSVLLNTSATTTSGNIVFGGATRSPNPYFSFYANGTSIVTSNINNVNTDIYNIVNVTTSDNILIPKGQPVHIVCFQGSYGSETINATNYYGIGFMIRETRTRYSMKYNGSNYLSSESAALVTDTDNITLTTNDTGSSTARGYKLLAIDNIRLSAVNKDGSFCNATRAIVKDNAGVTIATATFSGNVATFATDVKISIGSFFRIELDSNGSNYQAKRVTAPSYPQLRTNVSYVSGSAGGVDDAGFGYNIDSVETLVINTFAYCSSPLFTNFLLSKTSGYYQYKMPDIPRIAKYQYNVGDLASYDFEGITAKIVTSNIGYPLYVANTHGLLSVLTGNIKFHLGDVIAENNVLLSKGKSYILGTTDIIYADDEVVATSLTTTLTKVKEFVVKDTMTMNIYFEHQFTTDGGGAGTATVVSRIYKNGVAFGTLRSDTGGYVAYTESLALTSGDLIQLYTSSGRTVNPSVVSVKNFRVLGTIQREYRSDFIKSF